MSSSVLDLYTIGVGPSSSHTVGPMRAAEAFGRRALPLKPSRIRIELFGSLALTGKGHGTDRAIIAGLLGNLPESVDTHWLATLSQKIEATPSIHLAAPLNIPFNAKTDIIYNTGKPLPFHPNGMRFSAKSGEVNLLVETWYSTGGGFIVREGDHLNASNKTAFYPSALALFEDCIQHNCSVADLMWKRESEWRPTRETETHLDAVWQAMQNSIRNGLRTNGTLPGGLHVKRRAPGLFKALKESDPSDALQAMDWVNAYAIAVNEENAAGGRVVTAPTNGAAGVIPAVMRYCEQFLQHKSPNWHREALLTAGAIGLIFKENASISGADVGCQGEVGVACSMAAGALAAVMGASPQQVENAAEIGMEHNLGLTCDPIAGLVQIPCIERNAMGAVKAINAARLAMRGDGHHTVSLDAVIATMQQTGKDMRRKYKETARGGLAVNVVVC